MALVSPTDRQLMVLLVWTSRGMREILSVLGKIVQLTFDTSSGLGRPPDRHPGGITYRLTHLWHFLKDLAESSSWRKIGRSNYIGNV